MRHLLHCILITVLDRIETDILLHYIGTIRKIGFESIVIKFLEKGHTQNENDPVHSAIEKNEM